MLLLTALVHLLACAHGPAGAGRADTLLTLASGPASCGHSSPRAMTVAAEAEDPVDDGGSHCSGVDETCGQLPRDIGPAVAALPAPAPAEHAAPLPVPAARRLGHSSAAPGSTSRGDRAQIGVWRN